MDINDVIKLIEKGLSWQIVTLVGIFTFKGSIKDLINRFQEVKFGNLALNCNLSKTDEVTKMVNKEVPDAIKMMDKAIEPELERKLGKLVDKVTKLVNKEVPDAIKIMDESIESDI
ncbi:MAG: hypothetical protein ABSA86_02795 [Oryzomonas sp.]|jgi:hypothetical protein